MGTPALDRLGILLDADHVEAIAGEDFCDPCAHRAQPDDADRSKLCGHARESGTSRPGAASRRRGEVRHPRACRKV